jgi:rod shape determining protein RodA
MQPVEFAKIGTALMLANYVSGPEFNLKNRNHY